jgi:hypothetical protein
LDSETVKLYPLALLYFGLALAQRGVVGEPIDVDGLGSEIQNGTVQAVRLEQKRLSLETSFGQLKVLGYPVWLDTQNMIGSQVLALYRLLPDGPEARLEFSRSQSPFLLIGSHTSQLSAVVGSWRWGAFSTSSTQLNLLLRNQTVPLGQAVLVKSGLVNWCLRLAAIHLPTPETPGLSNEAERPRFDWAAWRVAKTTDCR